jgi:membrane-associated protein
MEPFALFDQVLDLLSGSPSTYAIVLAIATLDVLLPVLPSETAVITAGVLAGAGDLNVVAVIAAGAAGAMLGNNLAYGVGRTCGGRLLGRRGARRDGAAAAGLG